MPHLRFPYFSYLYAFTIRNLCNTKIQLEILHCPSLHLPLPDSLLPFPLSLQQAFSGTKLQSIFFIGTSAFYPLNLCLTWLFTPVNHTLRDAVISLPSSLQHYFRHNSSCDEPCSPAQPNCTPFIECYLCLFGLP